MSDGVRVALFRVAPVPRPLPLDPAVIEELEVLQGGSANGRDALRMTLLLRKTGKAGLEYDLLAEDGLEVDERLAVVAMVGATPFPLFDGVILDHQFVPGESPAESRLIVTGEDISIRMDQTEENRSYPRLADAMIAAEVVARYAKYGLIPPLPQPGLVDRTTIQTETDFEFLHRLARRNGFQFYAEPTVAPGVSRVVWGAEIRGGPPQPSLLANFQSGTNVTRMRFHLDAWAAEEVAVPGAAVSLPEVPTLAAWPQAPLRHRIARDTGPRATSRIARSKAERALRADALVAEGELSVSRYGEPLRPRELVGVRGFGPAHGGLYYVQQVVHRLRPRIGEYHQQFRLVRDGRGATTPILP